MTQAQFRFYEELNDFLPAARKKQSFSVNFPQGQTVKSLIEGLGVPHTEIDLILVNGQSVGFDYQLKEGDQVSVYPMFESLDITPLTRLRPKPLREPKFVLDTHLGRLASYLRMLGFDAYYNNAYADLELAKISSKEQRLLLTRDQELLKRKQLSRAYWVRSTKPSQQLVEILKRFDLQKSAKPLSRCIRCNQTLSLVPVKEVSHRLFPDVIKKQKEVKLCPKCDQIYWQGSHTQRMNLFIGEILKECS